eukprot:5482261-Pleurochrysis_carterae.AAC.1
MVLSVPCMNVGYYQSEHSPARKKAAALLGILFRKKRSDRSQADPERPLRRKCEENAATAAHQLGFMRTVFRKAWRVATDNCPASDFPIS